MAKLLKRQPLQVFLSYSHKNFKSVYSLWSHLRKDGLNVWLDKEYLHPGENWANEIRRAIIKSDIVIVCLSKQFNKKRGFRHQELKIALEKAKLFPDNEVFIVPIRLEKCDMPKSLQHLHRVDLFERGGYRELIHTLKSRYS